MGRWWRSYRNRYWYWKQRDQLLTSDTWKDEGQGWVAPEVSDYPVYCLLNPNTGDHHYTMDKNDSDNVILHRLYNLNAQETGMHHYPTNENKWDTLVSQGWTYEGTA